ncbi:MAG: hypothetical protein IJ795_05755 [Bacteroidales bacterium]|nr:hypothetical protein [Bacteroidales bacterium]
MDKVDGGIAILSIILVIVLLILGPCGEHPLGGGFTYFESPRMISYWNMKDTLHLDIPKDVLSYKNTLNYLLVKQRPAQYPDVLDDTKYVYPHGRDTVYYFFIDKRAKEVTGPLLYSEMETYLKDKDLVKMLKKLD